MRRPGDGYSSVTRSIRTQPSGVCLTGMPCMGCGATRPTRDACTSLGALVARCAGRLGDTCSSSRAPGRHGVPLHVIPQHSPIDTLKKMAHLPVRAERALFT
jgi:hypothetical protein